MDDRVLREKLAYDSNEIDREKYNIVLRHTLQSYYAEYKKETIVSILRFAQGKSVLELGSQTWHSWLYHNNILPEKTTCINISNAELRKGMEWYEAIENNKMNIAFTLMDANNLSFDDHTFDMVFGFGILHHLDFSKAIREISRVLKIGGQFMFYEPLGINPISKIIRFATPRARTKDEKPLGFKELRLIRRLFQTRFYYEQLFSVPLGTLSRFIYADPKNPLTKIGFRVDRFLDQRIPLLHPLYRSVIIHGRK